MNSSAYKSLKLNNFSDINEKILKYLGEHVIETVGQRLFYKVEENNLSVPKIIDFIRIDNKIHVLKCVKYMLKCVLKI